MPRRHVGTCVCSSLFRYSVPCAFYLLVSFARSYYSSPFLSTVTTNTPPSIYSGTVELGRVMPVWMEDCAFNSFPSPPPTCELSLILNSYSSPATASKYWTTTIHIPSPTTVSILLKWDLSFGKSSRIAGTLYARNTRVRSAFFFT